jgi:RNA polymerase sigma factor (sigma-70 family)
MKKRMSNDEAMDLFKKIEALKETNNHKEVQTLQNGLVQSLSFLVHGNTRRYRRFSNYDDLAQEGFIGLLKAVRRFDYRRFPNFFIFANQWISNSVKRAAKKYDVVYNPNRTKTVYLGDTELEETDAEYDLDELLSAQERSARVGNALASLTEREKTIVSNLFGMNTYEHTLRETEAHCDVTYERIRQIKNRIINKLKTNKSLIDIKD